MSNVARILLALGLSVGCLFAGSQAASQPVPDDCRTACTRSQTAATTRCAGNTSCVEEARFDGRRCAAQCIADPVARCRAQCQIDSDRCDAGCHGDRGCLRRCGSRHHISCPQQCSAERDPLVP